MQIIKEDIIFEIGRELEQREREQRTLVNWLTAFCVTVRDSPFFLRLARISHERRMRPSLEDIPRGVLRMFCPAALRFFPEGKTFQVTPMEAGHALLLGSFEVGNSCDYLVITTPSFFVPSFHLPRRMYDTHHQVWEILPQSKQTLEQTPVAAGLVPID
jgi:hypothetical protein